MPGAAPARKTVLIADDTAFVRDRFAAALEESGHEAITAGSAAQLLEHVRRDHARLDLILLDLQLPDSQGLELVRAIRCVEGGRVPIVVFSGTIAKAADVRELVSLGVAGYVNEYSAAPHILPALAPHLFPDNFNRRSSPRVAISVSVSCRVGNAVSSALTLNLSKGGLAIRTMNPLERGTLVKVRFRLPAPAREVDAEARVRWTDRNVGMGLQFERISAADQLAIDEFVDRHFFSNRKA